MEPRALLAVTAGIVGSELRVHLGDTNDVAILQADSGAYLVGDGFQSLGSFSMAAINAIRITGDAAKAGQSLVIRPGDAVADSLTVDAGVDATIVGAAIWAAGSVNIASAAITLVESVQTAGPQVYGGVVRLAKDVVLDAGDADILFTSPIRSTVGLHNAIRDTAESDQLRLSPGGSVLYASRGSSDVGSGGVHFIDLGGQGRDLVDLGRVVGRLALSADGSRLYAANPHDGTVTVVNTATRSILATIAASGSPTGMALSPDGQALYVTNSVDDSLWVISTATNGLVRTIPLTGAPATVAVGTDGRLWVTAQSGNRVSVVNAATGAIERQINVGRGPHGIAISPDGSRAYVTNTFDGTVSVISTTTGTVTTTVGLGLAPTEVAVTADGRWVYVVDGLTNAVSVIETASLTVATRVSVGNEPTGLALSADGMKAYVASRTGISELRNEARSLIVRTNGVIRFSAPESTVDRLRELVVQGNREIESAGSVLLSYNAAGQLRANGTPVTLNGIPLSRTPSGWTAVAAEPVSGGNTVVLRNNSSSHLHFLRMDAAWSQTSSDGWVAPATPEYFSAETTFGTDFNGDGTVGTPLVTVESAGSVVLATDGNGNLRANGTLITFGGAPFRHTTSPTAEWRVMAADTRGGVNTVVLRHLSGNLHFWRMDAGWRQVSSDGWVAPGSATFHATELAFGVDLDGNGSVTVEAAGGVTLTYDMSGNLRANGTALTFGGGPVHYQAMVAGGWTPMAAEADRGVNTIVLRHSSGNLHSWRMNAGWAQVSGDGWVAPRSNDFYASEVTYGVDLDGDGRLTIETAGSVSLSYDAEGNLRAGETLVISNGGPMNYHRMVEAGWRAVAAELHVGLNTIVLRHASGFLHFWRLDSSWNQVTGDGWVELGSRRFFTTEAFFGADLDGDGTRTIEAAGTSILTYDRTGAMRVGTTPVIFNGAPASFFGALAAGWNILAAELNQTRNTILLRHIATGHLHFWRFDTAWNQVSGDGWVAPGSPGVLTTETAFGVDINGNRTVGT